MEDDDFGDLYADLECQANAVAAGACGAARSEWERGGRASMVGEGVSVGDGDERRSGDGAGDGDGCRAGGLVLEAKDDDYGSGSESEDDLRIVLNEEDNSKRLMVLQRARAGNGAGSVVGGGQEDSWDGGLAVVAGFNHLNVEQQPSEGMIQSVKGIGNLSKNCYNSRFIGSQLAGYADISVVSSSSRAESDHLVIPSSGGSVSSSRMSTAVQPGVNFSLPRTRTIFDISIEALEHKPWRQHGIDITDYFNYGLNEESWICYWQNVDLLRQEAGLSSQCPSYESSKFQVSPKDMSRETFQSASGKNLFRETVEKSLKVIDMYSTKGRAIQVESSIGERLPSMDLRRSRQRDSDVVIQIKMDDSMNDGSIPYEEQSDMRQVDGPPPKHEEKLMDGMLNEDQSRNPGTQCDQEGTKDSLQANLDEMQAKRHCKKGDGEAPSGPSSFMNESACLSARDISSSSSSRFDNNSDTSEHSDALNKLHNSNKKASSSSTTGFQDSVKFDCDVSDDSGCNYSRSDEENDKMDDNKKPSSRNHDNDNRSEPKKMSEDDEASTQSCQKWQNFADSNGVCHRMREAKHGKSDAYWRDLAYHRDLGCYRERKTSGSYKSTRHTDERSSAKASYRNGIEDAYSRRKMVENNCLYEDAQDHYMARECFHSSERYLDNHKVKMYAQSHSGDSSSRLGYFLSEKDILQLERKRIKGHLIQDRHKHKDERQLVIQRRHPSCFDGINLNNEVVRTRSLSAREVRCSKSRDMYYPKLSPDRNLHKIYNKSDAKGSRQFDWTIDHEMHAPRTGYEKGRHHSSRNNVDTVMKLCDHSTNNGRHFDMRKINNGYGYRLESKKHLAPNKTSIEFEYHRQHYVEERYQYHNDSYYKTGERWISRPRASADDYGGLGHEELVHLSSRDGYYLRERSSRKTDSYLTQYTDDGTFSCDKNDMFSTTSINYCSRDDNRFPFENPNKRRLDSETIGHNEAVIVHLNAVKRKFHKIDHEVPGRSGWHLKKVKDGQNIQDAQDDPSYHFQLDSGHLDPISMKKVVSEFKVDPSHDRLLKMDQDNGQAAEDEIEEGQLIEEPCHRDVSMTKHRSSRDEAANHAVKKAIRLSCIQETMTLAKQNTTNGTESAEYDEKRILEMLAKMEKRRERFKEPLPPKQGVEKMSEVQINVAGLTYEAKLQRPVRKRQWGCR